MPNLDTNLHITMLRRAQKSSQIDRDGIYGLHWGRPDSDPELRIVRDNYLFPFINPDHTALEIGPGGGRWTKYLLSFGKVIAVDFYQPVIDEFVRQFRAPHLTVVKNNGTDFPGIDDKSTNFVWSYGTFVHLDEEIIRGYLASLPRILAPAAHVVIHYSDKRKPKARDNPSFSENDPPRMRRLVEHAGFEVVKEDTELLDHSAIMLIQLKD
jgi:SAM-dependent methyltransferase